MKSRTGHRSRSVSPGRARVRSWSRSCVVVAIAALSGMQLCQAATLSIGIADAGGKPIRDVVFVAKSSNDSAPRIQPPSAIMDQQNKEFVPEVLVVRTGTPVLFPNSDSVAHQVYSFSPEKRFTLSLYRGKQYPPVIFDRAGIVTLGCNIHDHMVGYVVVTDSPHFGQSDAQGRTTLKEMSAGTYKVSAWHPRFNEIVAEQSVTLADADASIAFRLQKPMQASRSSNSDRRIREY